MQELEASSKNRFVTMAGFSVCMIIGTCDFYLTAYLSVSCEYVHCSHCGAIFDFCLYLKLNARKQLNIVICENLPKDL